jgi:hypothetical protein
MQRTHNGKIYSRKPELAPYRCEGCDLFQACVNGLEPIIVAECAASVWKAEDSSDPTHLTDRRFVDNLWRWKCGLPEEITL